MFFRLALSGVLALTGAGISAASPVGADGSQVFGGVTGTSLTGGSVATPSPGVESQDSSVSVDERDVVVPPLTPGKTGDASPESTLRASADEPIVAASVLGGGRVETPVVETGAFQTLGVSWPKGAVSDPASLAIQVKTRTAGVWSGWEPLSTDDGGADPGTAEAARTVRDGTESLWVGDADAVQLSFGATTTGGPSGMSVALISSTASSSTARATASAAVADVTSSSAPVVITRAQWGARAPVCEPGSASTLVGAVLHHTAGSNSYSTVAAAEQQIRNDQQYHIGTRGWCDLGYNFVVDKWGNIYEGRAGSLTSPVIGAHAGGFNTGTVGVSMLGTYDAVPSAATQQAVARIVGWRLGAYGVDPRGTMTYSTGVGENSRFKNQTVTLPRVLGHRDVAYTACPGNGGYAALPNIRAMAADASYASRLPAAGSVVKAMYADLLLRDVDASGLQSWSAMLASGAAQPALVASLTSSDEYLQLRVRQAYEEVLGRAPEPGGVAWWVQEIRAGHATADDVKRRFYDSLEYFNLSGGTSVGYVNRLYVTAFERSASASESAYWAGQIPVIGRGAVVDGIWLSFEAAKYRAGKYYQTFLKRAADQGGQEYWARVLLASGEGAVRIGIAGSAEYRALALTRFP